jgi:hypothetical protein
MVWDEKRLSLIQDGRVGLRENHRLVRALQRTMEFLIMGGIVHANGKYFHNFNYSLGQRYKKNRHCANNADSF